MINNTTWANHKMKELYRHYIIYSFETAQMYMENWGKGTYIITLNNTIITIKDPPKCTILYLSLHSISECDDKYPCWKTSYVLLSPPQIFKKKKRPNKEKNPEK